MKKLLALALVSLALVSSAAAEGMKFGIGGGLVLPTGDAGDLYGLSPVVHGVLIYGWKENMDFEGQVGYWLLQADEAYDDADVTTSMLPFTGGIRFKKGEAIHLDAGAGLYMFKWEVDSDFGNIDSSETYFGVYGGAGYVVGNNIDLNARLHWPDFEDFMLGLTVSYTFGK